MVMMGSLRNPQWRKRWHEHKCEQKSFVLKIKVVPPPPNLGVSVLEMLSSNGDHNLLSTTTELCITWRRKKKITVTIHTLVLIWDFLLRSLFKKKWLLCSASSVSAWKRGHHRRANLKTLRDNCMICVINIYCLPFVCPLRSVCAPGLFE